MSAPDTNIEKQKRRHRGPLVGMAIGVGFALLLLLGLISWLAANGESPAETGTRIDAGTGAAVQTN